MKIIPLSVLVGAILSLGSVVQAQKDLPVLSESPWLGRWIGYEEEEFDFGIAGRRFEGEIHVKNRSREGMKRVKDQQVVRLGYILEEQVKGEWKRRTFGSEAFETSQGASQEAEEFEVLVHFKGGTKVKVSHVLDGEEIKISTEIVETESKKPIRVGVEVIFPDLYRIREKMSERELKKMMSGDEVVIKAVGGKKLKFDIYEEVNLGTEEQLVEGAVEFSLESKKLADKTLSLSSEVANTGKIFFTQKKSIHEGVTATWFPEENPKNKEVPVLLIEIE